MICCMVFVVSFTLFVVNLLRFEKRTKCYINLNGNFIYIKHVMQFYSGNNQHVKDIIYTNMKNNSSVHTCT